MFGIIQPGVTYGYAFALAQTGEKIFVSFDVVPEDEIGRKWLAEGEEIEFDTVPSTNPKKHKHLSALNLKILSPREPVNLDTYRESGYVFRVMGSGGVAFIRRGYVSANVYLHHTCVRGGKSNAFQEGEWYEYSLLPPNDKPSWRAANAVQIEGPKEEQGDGKTSEISRAA
jgi:cold shock CspA family protein